MEFDVKNSLGYVTSILKGVLENWKRDHAPSPFTNVMVLEDTDNISSDGPIAKVNLRTKELTIDILKLVCTAYRLGINIELFIYYTLSHELGHILYQQTDKTSNEEYFAHSYACHDCRVRLSKLFREGSFVALEEIKDKIILH